MTVTRATQRRLALGARAGSPRHMTRSTRPRAAALFALLALACTTDPKELDPPARTRAPSGAVPLWEDLGPYHRAVTTASPDAQRYFDQGLVLAYGFNHDAALAAFTEAARIDPSCGMAWWGIAYVSGPHINLPVQDPARARTAVAALERARACAGLVEVERALIDAQGARFSLDPDVSRAALDTAYAAAMWGVSARFPDDADVGALYAEALMNVHPWDLWTADGRPKNDVETITSTLERALTIAPDHPHANHLFIHAVEASPHPERAEASADRLRTLVPGSSHLLHMPSHIDVRTGKFEQASRANERAIAADARHGARVRDDSFYRLYMAHNEHMLAFASMMEGRFDAALQAARGMVAGVPPVILRSETGPIIDGLMPVVLHVLVRFGRWDDALKEPPFDPALRSSNAVRHYARGVSLAALDRFDEAEAEREALARAIADMDERPIGNNPAKLVLQVPLKVLEGELLFRRGERDEGLAALREAVRVEDTLLYDEPPDWMQPARHTLAASLLVAGRPGEAEQVAREDLRRFPRNVWSLTGLARALRAQGKDQEAQAVEAELAALEGRTDTEISSPCLCQPGEGAEDR